MNGRSNYIFFILQFCVAFIQTDQDMVVDEVEKEPCGIANVSSIGGLGVEDNKRYCNVFFKLVEQYVGIPQKRYLSFLFLDFGMINFWYE